MSKKKNKKIEDNIQVDSFMSVPEENNNVIINDDLSIKKKKRTRLIVTIVILLLFLSLLVLFLFKSNIIYPEFKLKGSKEVTLNFGEKYEEEGYYVKVFNKDNSKYVVVKDEVDYSTLGEYYIKYVLRLNYLNVDRVLKRKIIIVDKEKPTINIDSDDEVYINQYSSYNIPNYVAVDNYDGDITSKVEIDNQVNSDVIGEYAVRYSVSDTSGNTEEKVIKVIVEENKKNAYVVVSLSKQTLDYYEYGEVVLHSDVVTGNNGDTPVGTFSVVGKATDTILSGADYRTTVNYWIGFVGNSIGIHDAPWRSSFGGNIYKYNGSHGCVNVPYYKVQQLYNMVEIGTPVYIYY